MTMINGKLVQNEISRILNSNPDLPDFMHITGYEKNDYTIDLNGIVREVDGMEFITVDLNLSFVQIIHEIAIACIELSL